MPLGDDLVPLPGIREPGIGSFERLPEERTLIGNQRFVQLHRRLLYGAVWPGEDHCLVAIIKTHPVRWGAFGSQYLDDLGRPMGLADRAAVHVQAVADPCLHDCHLAGDVGLVGQL